MAQTIVEKIISRHSGKSVQPDDLVVVPVDGTMASDTTAPLAITSFRAMGGKMLKNPDTCTLVIDHAAPAPNERIANLHQIMRDFAHEQGCRIYEAGQGICHQLLLENNHIAPGQLFIGADSHTCSAGSIGTLGAGVGATDLAAVWLTGKIWLRVPASIRINIENQLPRGVQSKDLILAVLGKTGIAGATYKSLEISGDAVAGFSTASRIVMANMMVEAGAKTGFIHPDGLAPSLLSSAVYPDPDAVYETSITLDAAGLSPMIARPHSPADTCPVTMEAGRPIQYAFIGTCSNGRLEDLHLAASILKDSQVHPTTRLVIGPASRSIFLDAVKDGTIEILTAAGATIIPPGCGPCVGTHNGVPGNGETVISTGNRNFKGRMGNPFAEIFLASPATVAVSARKGKIADPTPYISDYDKKKAKQI